MTARRLESVLLAAALGVLAWPRIKCWPCGERVWGWQLRRHLQGHIDTRRLEQLVRDANPVPPL